MITAKVTQSANATRIPERHEVQDPAPGGFWPSLVHILGSMLT